MKPIEEWDEKYLKAIVQASEKESLNIEYKTSESLNFDNKSKAGKGGKTLGEHHREEFVRDIVAMANADGGHIIYGIDEDGDGYPANIDDGYDAKKTSTDRVQQILTTRIHPRLDGVQLKQIELKSKGLGAVALAILVPRMSPNAPHQASDKYYYKRHGSTRMIMEDYEIRDVMRRSIEFGKKFGVARDLLLEVNRLAVAASERLEIQEQTRVPRQSLSISVSNALRTSGMALMSLPRVLREDALQLVRAVERYNSAVEIFDPGQRESLRLSKSLRELLIVAQQLALKMASDLGDILKGEPD